MTNYTTEADIEAMAEAIDDVCREDVERGYMPSFNNAAKAALAASPVHAELAKVEAENKRLRECLQFFQDDQHNKPKHILSFHDILKDEQYERIKQQCNKEFGVGMFILLEGGLKYEGMTHHQALQQKEK